MSQENVEIVQRGFVVFAETGEPEWDVMSPEIEIYDHDLMDASVYRGHDGYRSWVANWTSTFPEFGVEPLEFIDAGDRVVAILRMTVTGAGSGATVEREDAIVYGFEDGMAVRLDYFNNRAQALESVGLES